MQFPACINNWVPNCLWHKSNSDPPRCVLLLHPKMTQLQRLPSWHQSWACPETLTTPCVTLLLSSLLCFSAFLLWLLVLSFHRSGGCSCGYNRPVACSVDLPVLGWTSPLLAASSLLKSSVPFWALFSCCFSLSNLSLSIYGVKMVDYSSSAVWGSVDISAPLAHSFSVNALGY